MRAICPKYAAGYIINGNTIKYDEKLRFRSICNIANRYESTAGRIPMILTKYVMSPSIFQIDFKSKMKSGNAHNTGGYSLEFESKSKDNRIKEPLLNKNKAG